MIKKIFQLYLFQVLSALQLLQNHLVLKKLLHLLLKLKLLQQAEETIVQIPRITCERCSFAEQETLEFFYDNGVKDKHALAMIMGLSSKSRFQPSVCEGGFITSWRGRTCGGFGLIQFTSNHRYYGLGNYAARTGQLLSHSKRN